VLDKGFAREEGVGPRLQQQLGGKPLVLQEFCKKPGGPGRTFIFTEVGVLSWMMPADPGAASCMILLAC
jgi:hypothetical protein